MTTPDKEEMPTEDRTAGDFWAEKRDGRWQLQMRHRGPGSSFCVAQINHWADNSEALTTRIANACNAYEPMRKALQGYIDNCTNEECEHCIKARAALKGVPQPASDSYQAGASAPALSEKFTLPSEQEAFLLRDFASYLALGPEFVGAYRAGLSSAMGICDLLADEFGSRNKGARRASAALSLAADRIDLFLSKCTAKLNFSNEAERDAVSLKSDTSSQPASEAGKLSSEAQS